MFVKKPKSTVISFDGKVSISLAQATDERKHNFFVYFLGLRKTDSRLFAEINTNFDAYYAAQLLTAWQGIEWEGGGTVAFEVADLEQKGQILIQLMESSKPFKEAVLAHLGGAEKKAPEVAADREVVAAEQLPGLPKE
jgi:hypothetical protein